VDSRAVIKELEKDGWYEVNRAGSHKQFKHAEKKGRVTAQMIPHDRSKNHGENHGVHCMSA
jgi:predicted RNA binding protein YcfA (HicA-like mRNA interferase family)